MLGLPSHITLLYPFMPLETASPEHLSQLAHIFDHTPSIRFVLSEVGWFDQRVLYLRPDVADQFVDLTAAIVKEFPEFPPTEVPSTRCCPISPSSKTHRSNR